MAIKITYEDKVAIQNNEDLPNENKITDKDMNEIKKAVNNNADELVTAQGNISELEGKNTANETNIQELQNKLNESETNISNLQKDNTTNKADIASIKEKNTEQDTRLTNIENKNTEQDTNIQGLQDDITNIKQEQNAQNTKLSEIEQKNTEQDGKITAIEQKNTEQDDSIEELKNTDIELKEENERLKNDIDCIAITEEAEGENLTLTETSDARFSKFNIKGNTSQETREGYNILETTLQSQTINGLTITVNEDKSITINGTSTTELRLFINDNLNISLQGDYGFYLIGKNSKVNLQGTVNALTENYIKYADNFEFITKNYAEASTLSNIFIYIQNNTTFNNETYKVMITKGTEQKEYEQYGVSPSFEYPSELKTIKDTANIAVCNKNFLKITSITRTVTKNGVTITIDDDGLITIDGTCTTNWWPDLTYNISNNTVEHSSPKYYVPKFEKITFSAKYVSGSVNTSFPASCVFTEEEGQRISIVATNNSVSISLNIKANTFYRAYLTIPANTVFNNYKFYLQLEEGEIATDYVASEEQAFAIPVQQEMLPGDGFEKVNGVWKEKHGWTSLTENGSTNAMTQQATGTEGKHRYTIAPPVTVPQCDINTRLAYCNKFKLLTNGSTHSCKTGFTVAQNRIWLYDEGEDLTDFKAKLADNPITFKLPLVTPTYINCIEEQIAILDEIEKTIHTYKEKTHIYSTDNFSPIFDVKVKKDTQLYIESQINSKLENINQVIVERS